MTQLKAELTTLQREIELNLPLFRSLIEPVILFASSNNSNSSRHQCISATIATEETKGQHATW
jgi:hypothetical protein